MKTYRLEVTPAGEEGPAFYHVKTLGEALDRIAQVINDRGAAKVELCELTIETIFTWIDPRRPPE